MRPERVWYVAYGSNVDYARFMRYLAGSDLESGARDGTPPRRHMWATAQLRLTFAGVSVKWNGGGVAFVDADSTSETIVRAWDITAEQFEDVFAQENRATVGLELNFEAITSGPTEFGDGRYRRVLPLDLGVATADHPALTFTWASPLPFNAPDPSYLDTIRRGLTEHDSLSELEVDAYLRTHAAER